MTTGPSLFWLPEPSDWPGTFARARRAPPAEIAQALTALARTRLDTLRTAQLDRILKDVPHAPGEPSLRLAVLSSCTVSHLLPAIRVGALRRGLRVEIHETPFGDYLREVSDPGSGLHAFRPDAVLLAFDAAHLARETDSALTMDEARAALDRVLARLASLWQRLRDGLGCQIVQQTLLPTVPPLVGQNEQRLPSSRARTVAGINARLREAADAAGVDLLALDEAAARDGLDAWHDPVWWLRARQDVRGSAAPVYGDLVARLLAARRGLSRKCLVLDLDNTLWGGVIGDDGIEGIVLGPGNAEGEAFLAVQALARDLARRGVILAVVSKNDEAVARDAVERHPEMLLRGGEFAAFVANWDDKPGNLRRVAQTIGIGLDSLVFVDDNPFERELVRSELPMVAVPELPEDPALWPRTLAAAGYFEAVSLTEEDRTRAASYAASAGRRAEMAATTDLGAYLADLDMRLVHGAFDGANLPRIVQLINKTNQFNLTTPRLQAPEVEALMADPAVTTWRFRLLDRFGDNGIIGLVAGRRTGDDLSLDLWLMSCRVIGREVESAMLGVVAAQARRLGVRRLVGLYRPTPKNGMVRDLYGRLGFTLAQEAPDGVRLYHLSLDSHAPNPCPIRIEGG